MRTLPIWLVACLLIAPAFARAQDQSTEDKLRDLLRRSGIDLRAAQDSLAQMQADRDAAVRQRDQLQQQLAAAQQQLASATAKQATPQAPAPPPDEVAHLQEALDAAQRQNTELAAGLAKWQAAYHDAAALAQGRDSDAKRATQALQVAQKESQLSQETNDKLVGVCNDILHLYQSTDFRGILLRSYEPVLGLGKVKLDNIVQDYEDRIYKLRLFAKPAP